jgi:D-sedoheptulose 7-phosphate isomerase
LAFGNGGSAADAQHLTAELSGRFEKDRRGLPAVALTTNPSAVTAIANDYSYDDIFSRQLQGLVAKGDIVVAISTSGHSRNVLEGVKEAKRAGA